MSLLQLCYLCTYRFAAVSLFCASPAVGSTLWPSWLCIRAWSPRPVANPTLTSLSFFFLLLYRSLLCSSCSSRPPNPQNVPQAPTDEHLQLLLESLGGRHQVSEPNRSTAFTFIKTIFLLSNTLTKQEPLEQAKANLK